MSSYGALADWYDSLTEDVDYEGLYDYLMAILRRNGVKPERVLDMACGTGSLSVLFAENGSRCYGMDLSTDMLTRAFDKAQDMDNPPMFLHGNMADFTLPEQVDVLVCMLDSFNYMAQPEQGVSAISCFARAVRPGGMLIFDVRPPEQLRASGKSMDDISEIVQHIIDSRNDLRQRVNAGKQVAKADRKGYYRTIGKDLIASVDGAFTKLSDLVKQA